MNLIDFHVTEIISEEFGKVYELYSMTEEQALIESKDNEQWRKVLFSDGIKQKYKYWDDGGENIDEKVFVQGKLKTEEKYCVGYIGQH